MVIEPEPMIVIFGVTGENLTGTELKATKCVTFLAQRLIVLL